MMAAAGPPSTSSFLPLLETLEDGAAGQSEQTDAYLTVANRLSGEEGRQFLPAVEKHFPRLGKVILTHVSSPNAELSQAALQALGFCVYHSHVVSGVSEVFGAEILTALCTLVTKATDKNTCTRALWVISKQNFPADVVAKKVPSVLSSLESVWTRQDVQSVVMEHEALNVVIRMLEQVPAQMGDGAVQWTKLVVPLVVHSASKVRLRAAAAMELGMPLLLAKQTEVAAVIEPMMSSKLIPELQKLFMSKNETNVLKLWPLFVKLLGKLLHRGGPFINSLLHLEELGFRSSSPTIKKIAFIAWKSLIDNFALNPDILCSAKRMKLLMQPLVSISVRTEALLLTKVEVWWYLVVQLGPNLSSNFDQVSVPLLQTTIGSDSSSVPGTPSRAVTQNGSIAPSTPKSGGSSFNTSASTPRLGLNSSMQAPSSFPSIQLLGLEMLLHYFLGPEVVATAAKSKLVLNLEPLKQPLLSGSPSFTKHAAVLIANIRDGFINAGKDAPEALLTLIWTSLVRFVSLTVESGGKKDRQGCEVLTLMLQALQSIVSSEVLPVDRVLVLLETTVKGVPHRVLASASYQVGKMDVLNGTPALFLILLLFNSSMLPAYLQDERFFHCLHTLVGCGLLGPASPLAFAEAVLGAIGRCAASLQDKEQLWRMWSSMVGPLTDTITQSNEVNQGDALEHNFSAMHSALMFPVTHLLRGSPLPQATQKSMLSSWARLYKVFARCSALVVTAEENVCCEELCARMAAAVDREALAVPATLSAVSGFLHVMVDCVDFSPYTPQFQQKLKSPHTPVNWTRKRNKALGNLTTFQSLLVDCLQVYLDTPDPPEATGPALVSILMALFSNLVLNNAVREVLTALVQPLTQLYRRAGGETSGFGSSLQEKLEKLLADVLGCLQTRSMLAFDDELLALMTPLLCVLFPHRNKHLRTAVTQFWNATFGNAVSLAYPEEIRPILSQVKQKIPIILPGFEAVGVPGELSEQYSSESSEMETKLSGIPVSSAGKRESLLGKAAELNNLSSTKTSKPVSTKLDFSSPKLPRRAILEEEASIDFVFIPPETKERVLTEHQKEVKRTKRVDIPAMYNNLDASLDTSVFTQFTQSQDDTSDKAPTEPADDPKQAPDEVPLEDDKKEEETQDYASPKDDETGNAPEEEPRPDSAAVSMDTKTDEGAEAEDRTSPNISASSDLVSGTPQRLSSRRQSFITLETYAEGKPASPSSSSSSFTGPLLKTSNTKDKSTDSPKSQDPPQMGESSPQGPMSEAESPRRPKESTKTDPVRLIEKLPSESTEDEDVIPDTQTEAEEKPNTVLEENLSAREQESGPAPGDSQASPDEPRRSGRHRVRPLLPGEDPEDREAKYRQRRSGEAPKDEDAKTPPQSRPNTRSKLAAEERSGRVQLRSRSRDSGESSQTSSQARPRKKMKLFSSSEDFLDKPERKRRSASETENSQADTQSDGESQSQRRRSRSRRSAAEMDEKDASSQPEEDGDSQTVTPSPQTGSKSQETKSDEKMEEDGKLEDEQDVLSQSQAEDVSQQNNSQMDTSSPAESKDGSADKLESETMKDKNVAMETKDETLSQEDSQSTPSSGSQMERRSRRSKAPSEVAKSGDVTESVGRQRRSQSLTPVPSQAEAGSGSGGRTRRSKVQEELSISSPSSAPVASQSVDVSGSESSQDRGRYSRRGSSPASAAGVESSESESSEVLVIPGIPKRRGRKPKKSRTSLPSPLVVGSQETGDASQRPDSRSLEESSETQDLQEVPGNLEEERNAAVAVETHPGGESPSNTEQRDSKKNREDIEKAEPEPDQDPCPSAADSTEPPEPDQDPCPSAGDFTAPPEPDQDPCPSAGDFTAPPEPDQDPCPSAGDFTERPEPDQDPCPSAGDFTEPPEPDRDPCPSAGDSTEPPNETTEKLDVSSGTPEDKDVVAEKPSLESDSDHQEVQSALEEDEIERPGDAGQQLPESRAEEDGVSLPEDEEEDKNKQMEDEEKPTEAALGSLEPPVQDSPVKLKDEGVLMGPDVAQSPSDGRARGSWSPSASPSTSILKKGQKRPLEVETISPLVKSRRVSFANPIQQQETADDIDRRSPAVRTSSPRRPKASGIPQPKLITTPTKGALMLSPRNLHSSGHKSSKKCLISEMSQEPRAVSRHCIYPALVGCSAPVEAVLPQISSSMWSRGFGQLVRARNIKTVGDLSALTPAEVKTLPICSPKISNVKKALKIYEQQRRGRGGDELKSFDETEMMTSELEESGAPQTAEEEEEKTSAETLATELADEPGLADVKPERTASATPDGPDGLALAVEALTCRATPLELHRCSPQQLVDIHQQLGGVMRSVVVELQTRLCGQDLKVQSPGL